MVNWTVEPSPTAGRRTIGSRADVSAMTSGRETLANIEQAIQDLRQREQAIQTNLEGMNAKRADIIAQRLQAYRELAEVRARHAVSDGVIDQADRLSNRVENLLIARQKTIDELKSRLARADDNRATLIRAREVLSDRIEKLETRLDHLALEAREALSHDPVYRQQLTELKHAEATLEKANEKSQKSEATRVAKSKAYENDPLFMYLWRRNWGTNSYRASNIIKWLDGKVAALISYHGARANYAILNEIPTRLAAHVETLRSQLDAKRLMIDARESEKIRDIAHSDLPGQLREARTAETQNRQAFEETSAELSDLGEQINKYAEGQDPAFIKAVDISAQFLSQSETTRLMQLARETTSPSDDQIAARIAKLDSDVSKTTAEIDEKTAELEKLFDKRDELVRVAADFRRAHYDDPASVFRGNDVGTILLQELIRGAIDGAGYWARTRRRQSWRNRPADSYRRSESFPPFDDMFGGWGDDRGRGGWSDGGGDSWSHGDDDFGTGGGF